jgi:radical SAM protein with 4Fe4S-binding SPASM domain
MHMIEKATNLRLLAWEATRACAFACRHCRAEAQRERDPQELTLKEIFKVWAEVAERAKPILIITGGDPLLRQDIFQAARYATDLGFKVVMSPSGSKITPAVVKKLQAAGVRKLSLSLDGSNPEIHDGFRQVKGAFALVLKNAEILKEFGLPFQINTTITPHNVKDLAEIYNLALRLGAQNWDLFMLVPTGRAKELTPFTPAEYTAVLDWIAKQKLQAKLPIKITCSPQYPVITGDWGASGNLKGEIKSKGCMAGAEFCFISHTGEVYGCGYLPLAAGNIKSQSFWEIYNYSPLFTQLRQEKNLKGKCSICEFKRRCGGCRARAYGVTGDYLEAEPFCTYEPSYRLDDKDKFILNLIQEDFPLELKPYAKIGKEAGLTEAETLARLKNLKEQGIIRYIGPVFETPKLNLTSVLAAAAVPSERQTQIAALINQYQEVTHNYGRAHHYNLWFTVTAPTRERIKQILTEIKQAAGLEEIICLPATKTIKSKVKFNF